MTSPADRYLFQLSAQRMGIHWPILAALQDTHGPAIPNVPKLEWTLGVVPAGEGDLKDDDLAERSRLAAIAVRRLNDNLARQRWQPSQFWDATDGQYEAEFIEKIAAGIGATSDQPGLSACEGDRLIASYRRIAAAERTELATPAWKQSQASGAAIANRFSTLDYRFVDRGVLDLAERVPQFYKGLAHQRQSLFEMVQIWRGLDSYEATVAALGLPPINFTNSQADEVLLKFVSRVSQYYGGYPQQREALLRLVQLWRQLDSRQAAIESLAASTTPTFPTEAYDLAALDFILRLPEFYKGTGMQRNALSEMVRVWRNLESRSAAINSLGIDPAKFASDRPLAVRQDTLGKLDRELISFLQRVPSVYSGRPQERGAIIRLVQIWRDLDTRQQALGSLEGDLQTLEWTVMLINTSTVFKTRPIQSNDLPEDEKVTMPRGELSLLESVSEGSHHRITTVEPINGRRQWYVYRGHVDFLEPATMLIKNSTVFKTKPVSSSNLGEQDKVSVSPGEFNIRSYEDAGVHLRIRLVTPLGDRLSWYVYKEHIELLNVDDYPAPKDEAPEPETEPTPAPAPAPAPKSTPAPAPAPAPRKRGRGIRVPGIGLVGTNDPIVPGGNFTWGEATKEGNRIPANSTISRNIVTMARRMESIRTRLGDRPMRITSWYRPPAVNRAVGGARNSTHLYGHGVDFVVDGLSARSAQRILDPWWSGGLGYGPNFTHVDNRGYRARWNYS
ncbi:MAG: D-Ala-D-Ala carboxypeptidase family metallohydrolase [Cyanobacteria bacterium P01_D01_bin.73]